MTTDLATTAQFAAAILSELEENSRTAPGVTRDSFGPGEQRAHETLRRVGRELDLEERIDAMGNLYLTLPGANRQLPAIFFGSHLDSVPHGGNYDGAAGVVAGAGVLFELHGRRATPERDVTVMATRAEEAAWFPLSYPGTAAALGRLPAEALAARRADTGRSLAEHMRDWGFDPDAIARGEAQIAPERIAAFVELHIEQGPRLIARDLPVAIVTAINGGFRYTRARCLGAYAHSGAEPRFSRRDAVLGFSDFVQATERLWDDLEAEGVELTISFGRVESDPEQHGGSRVLGEIGFCLDVRNEHQEVLDRVDAALREIATEVEERRSVTFDLGPSFTWPPARMDPGLVRNLHAAAGRSGVPVAEMSSGAGHDAAAFAEAGVPSATIFVRNENGSHNADEAMEIADLAQGIALMTEFVLSFPD